MLDAGAGTGALSRELAAALPTVHPVLVDLSPAMLARAEDLRDLRAVASLDALPFHDGQFDVVLCAWVIETVDDPRAVVTELLRVLRPGGLLLYSFCSRPRGRGSRWRSGLLRAVVHSVFAGHFLANAWIPFHDCEVSSRASFAHGAVTLVSLGTAAPSPDHAHRLRPRPCRPHRPPAPRTNPEEDFCMTNTQMVSAARLELEHPMSLGVHHDYVGAQHAVDYFSDQRFPVKHVEIVGTELRSAERITGRLTRGKIAAAGVLSGLWIGLLRRS